VPDFPHLPNAPITEAIIDLRIKPTTDFDLSRLEALYEAIKEQYPEKTKQKKSDLRVEIKAEGPSQIKSSDTILGYFFRSTDKKQIFQARLDGFTFNRLKPYKEWESFRDEAKRLWRLYADILSPLITRVAVRYINRFDIPLPLKDFNEYLIAAPVVPPELPQGVPSFFSRVVILVPEIEATAVMTQVLEQVLKPTSVPIIFDIDAYRENAVGISEHDAWALLEKLRHLKNEIFFYGLTDKAKEMFK